MDKANKVLGLALRALGCVILVLLGIALWFVIGAVSNLKGTVGHANSVTAKIDAYLTPDVLKDLHNDVTTSVVSGQTTANAYGAVAEQTVDTLQNHVNPGIDRSTGEVARSLKALTASTTAAIDESKAGIRELKGAITAVKTDLVPSLVSAINATNKLVDKFGLTVDEATEAIKIASEKTGKSIDELNRQIADPRWGQAADNLVKATGSADLTLEDFHSDLHATMSQWPHITAQIDKTATNISRFSKISIIAGIVSNLANGFIPGLLK